MNSVKFIVWIGCLIQITHLVLCNSNEDPSSPDSISTTTPSSEDLETANSNEEDAVFIKNCSEAKTISKRETDRLSQVKEDKDDISNNGTGDMSPKRNSPMNLHEIPLTFSEKDEANANEDGDTNTVRGFASSNEVNSFEEGSSTNNPQEEDIIVVPLPPRPIFIQLIFFKTNRSSSRANGTSIGNFKKTDFSLEDISASSSVQQSNENGSNLTRSGPHGPGFSDMKESSERDETTGLEHVRLANFKTGITPTTMQTTASLDEDNNEDSVLRSTRNSDNFNLVESSSVILGKTESSSPSSLAQNIIRLPSTTPSPLDIVGQGLRHRSINSDEDADTNSSSGTHMPVTVSNSELQRKSNRRESKSSATASPGLGNRRRRDTIFSHLTNNSQAGSSQDGKHSSEKKLVVATSTTLEDSNDNTATASNLPDVSAGESLEVIVSGSSSGIDNPKLRNSTTSHPGGDKGIIAAFMEILGIGGSGIEDNNNRVPSVFSNANITNTTTLSPSNSNQNSTSSSAGQRRRVSRAANGPTGNGNPSSSPSPTSSTPIPTSSTSTPDGKAGADKPDSGSGLIPLLNVPSAGTNTTKFKKNQSN